MKSPSKFLRQTFCVDTYDTIVLLDTNIIIYFDFCAIADRKSLATFIYIL